MTDKDWLERVRTAATVYGVRTDYETAKTVDDFVRWLWREWGYKWVDDGSTSDIGKKDEQWYRDRKKD